MAGVPHNTAYRPAMGGAVGAALGRGGGGLRDRMPVCGGAQEWASHPPPRAIPQQAPGPQIRGRGQDLIPGLCGIAGAGGSTDRCICEGSEGVRGAADPVATLRNSGIVVPSPRGRERARPSKVPATRFVYRPHMCDRN